jgi:hypothetical protein
MANPKTNAVMIDLEFLNVTNSAAVLSCGMTAYNKDTLEVGESYGFNFDLADGIRRGLTIGADTLLWWIGQDKAAIQAAFDNKGKDFNHSLEIGIAKIGNFISKHNAVELMALGGRDFAIIYHICEVIGMSVPWDHRIERDLRTLREEHGAGISVPDVGTAHNAIDDSKYQVNLLIAIRKKIRGVKEAKGIKVASVPDDDEL